MPSLGGLTLGPSNRSEPYGTLTIHILQSSISSFVFRSLEVPHVTKTFYGF